MSGANSRVSDPASTTSASSQRRTEETKEGGGAGRGHGRGCGIASKWQENEQEKVNAGSRGRGRGYLLSLDSTDSSGESTNSGRGETLSRTESQNYSGSSNIPSASGSGSGTGPHCQSRISGTNNNVAASTTSASSQRNKTEETKAGGGAGRGSSYSNSGRQVGHPPGEPKNYYNNLSGKAHPKPCQKKEEDGQKPDVSSKGQSTTTFFNLDRESNQACEPKVIATYSLIGNANEFSSEEETEQRANQPKKSESRFSRLYNFFSRSSK
jgi:hypothetical protein